MDEVCPLSVLYCPLLSAHVLAPPKKSWTAVLPPVRLLSEPEAFLCRPTNTFSVPIAKQSTICQIQLLVFIWKVKAFLKDHLGYKKNVA